MTNRKLLLALVICAILSPTGCSFGDPPAGMSESDAKAAIAAMKPEDRIRAIASSPLRQPDKDREYAKIEAETGVKASDVLKGQAPSTGTGK